jgi:hypothetical protein
VAPRISFFLRFPSFLVQKFSRKSSIGKFRIYAKTRASLSSRIHQFYHQNSLRRSIMVLLSLMSIYRMNAKVFAKIRDERWLFFSKNRLEKAPKAPCFCIKKGLKNVTFYHLFMRIHDKLH